MFSERSRRLTVHPGGFLSCKTTNSMRSSLTILSPHMPSVSDISRSNHIPRFPTGRTNGESSLKFSRQRGALHVMIRLYPFRAEKGRGVIGGGFLAGEAEAKQRRQLDFPPASGVADPSNSVMMK
jgi:hypothetical protein